MTKLMIPPVLFRATLGKLFYNMDSTTWGKTLFGQILPKNDSDRSATDTTSVDPGGKLYFGLNMRSGVASTVSL